MRLLLGILFSFSTLLINAQEILGTYYGMYDDNHIAGDAIVIITKSEISIDIASDMYTGNKSSFRGQYQILNIPPFRYLKYGGMQWMLLAWPDGIYIEMKGGYYNFLSVRSDARTTVLEDGWDISSSSYLQENGTDYIAGNLSYMNALPWASAHGYGIGDRINIKLNGRDLPMLIQNGFVSIKNPKLYLENSRLKLFRLTSLKTGRRKEVAIKDEPDFQRVEIRDIAALNNTGEVIFLDVLNVFEGTKYKDLCIQRIIPDFSEK